MLLGAIQIISDTHGGGIRDSVTKYHKEDGGSQPKCHLTLKKIFFWYFCLFKSSNFWKN